jgi:hypothetical protein
MLMGFGSLKVSLIVTDLWADAPHLEKYTEVAAS